MNRYDRLRFVVKSSRTLQSEHVNVRHLGFSKSIVVYYRMKCPFCQKGVLRAHNIPHIVDSTSFFMENVSKVHVMVEH